MKPGNMFQNRLMHRIVDKFKRNKMKRIVIKFNREAVCMGDDVNNNIYQIGMPGDATLGDLMYVVKEGGCGNDWPVTSGFEWDIYSNIGRIARIPRRTEEIVYYDNNKDMQLSSLDIQWVYAARDIDEVNVDKLEGIFSD